VDPDVIVLGGELAAAGATLGDAVRAEVRRRALPLVTRHLDVSTAMTTADPEAPGRAALTALRGDAALVAELVGTVLAE
jgi:predicted NBD/HSP70 family sugar kinase